MINGKRIFVIMPAYNAAQTLEKTYKEIPFDVVDEVILTDDHSSDNTFEVAKKIGIKHVIRHEKNKGYGGNQKTCYLKALELGADIVIMVHPDYQYTPNTFSFRLRQGKTGRKKNHSGTCQNTIGSGRGKTARRC